MDAYQPINRLKPVAGNVWIVDGPIIRFGMPWPKMPFPTRMTIIRLRSDALLIHSPTPLTAALAAEIDKIGKPRWVIGPNRIHYWWIPEWRSAYDNCDVYLAPRIKEQAGGHIPFDGLPLEATNGYPWDAEVATLPVTGAFMTEVEFFHRATRTLVLTDFIENFEISKVDSLVMRWLTRLGGVQHPDGQMPRDMRYTFRHQKAQLRAAVETMIAWDPERIIIAHGRWYETDGATELRRAFRWLLD